MDLTSYYRRFVRDYGKIVKALTQLLKKDSFMWTDIARVSFEAFKREMVDLSIFSFGLLHSFGD